MKAASSDNLERLARKIENQKVHVPKFEKAKNALANAKSIPTPKTNKMKTPLQELIEILEEFKSDQDEPNDVCNRLQQVTIEYCISKATELREKEREQKPQSSEVEQGGVDALKIAEAQGLSESETAFFIAGWQECIKSTNQDKPQSSEVSESNIDMSDWHFCKVYGFREGVDKCSGCDQDKPQSSEVDVMDFISKEAKKKSGVPFTSIDKVSVEWCIELMGKWAELSTNQDKVREAAEKVVRFAKAKGGMGYQMHDLCNELEKALTKNK